MKTQTKILLCLVILSALPLINASECQHETQRQFVPCEVITDPDFSCTENATITSESNSTLNSSVEIFLKNETSQTFNFSFPFRDFIRYKIQLCDGAFAFINVVADDDVVLPDGTGLSFDQVRELSRGEIRNFITFFGRWIKENLIKYGVYVGIGIFLLVALLGLAKRKKQEKKHEK